MHRLLLFYIRLCVFPFTVLGIGGLVAAALVAYFKWEPLVPIFPILIWFGLIGVVGVLLAMVLAPLILCGMCGRRALVFVSGGFDSGNTYAIYETETCHHCGAKL
ncbi:MAG: hypothetical protein E6Q34_07535 [Burkholderiaceae bacterium]|nr:MAG: hypothetical protein E6Q34_07535 [Burkholderiaceae bacterium]